MSTTLLTTPIAATTGINWPALFSRQQQTNYIPGIAQEHATRVTLTVRDMYIDLAELERRLAQAGSRKPAVLIYADVVRIPAGSGWVVRDGALVIVARRIEAEEGAQISLDYRKSAAATLTIYAQELTGALEVVAAGSPGTQEQPAVQAISSMPALGLEFGMIDGRLSLATQEQLPDDMLQGGSDLAAVLGATFHYASTLLDTQPVIAGAMLQWIQTCAAQAPALNALFLQSAALLVMLRSSAGNVTFVPYLSRTLYRDLARDFSEAAAEYERRYERFLDKQADLKARAEAAGLMVKNYQASTAFFDKQILESQQSLDEARGAVRSAYNTLIAQKHTAEQAQVAFRSGLEVWTYEKQLEMAGKIILGIFEFAAAITALLAAGAAAVATGGAAAPVAGGAAAGVGGAVTALTTIGKTVSTAADMAKEAPELKDTIEQIGTLIETLQKTYVFIEQIVQLSKEFNDSQAGHQDLIAELNKLDLTVPQGADLSAGVYWSKFRLEAQKTLEPAIQQDVPGARDYQLQLDMLVVYGQSLAANQLSAVKLGQELARLLLQRELNTEQQRNVEDYIKQLNAGQQPNDEMINYFHERYVDVKRSLFLAVKNYTWAYKYWALRDSQVVPALAKKVDDLKRDMARITEDYANALQSFNPPPQDFEGKTFVLAGPDQLRKLRENRSLSWSIALDDRLFRGFDRVRIKTVRVWLEGATSLGDSSIYIVLSSSGNYQDRLYGKIYSFTTSPLQRAFEYEIAPVRSKAGILVDGKVADEQRYDYFVPTPFTNWQIELPAARNADLDLTGLSKIVVEFAGTALLAR